MRNTGFTGLSALERTPLLYHQVILRQPIHAQRHAMQRKTNLSSAYPGHRAASLKYQAGFLDSKCMFGP